MYKKVMASSLVAVTATGGATILGGVIRADKFTDRARIGSQARKTRFSNTETTA